MTDPNDREGVADHPVAHVDSTLEALIPRFLDRRREDVAAIETLVSRGEYETISSMGHSIKGSGGGYGFDPITEFGAELEVAARAADADATRAVARKLAAYIDAVEVIYVDD